MFGDTWYGRKRVAENRLINEGAQQYLDKYEIEQGIAEDDRYKFQSLIDPDTGLEDLAVGYWGGRDWGNPNMWEGGAPSPHNQNEWAEWAARDRAEAEGEDASRTDEVWGNKPAYIADGKTFREQAALYTERTGIPPEVWMNDASMVDWYGRDMSRFMAPGPPAPGREPPMGWPTAPQPTAPQPPAPQPPASQPPASQPPAGQPPTSQPPASQPPESSTQKDTRLRAEEYRRRIEENRRLRAEEYRRRIEENRARSRELGDKYRANADANPDRIANERNALDQRREEIRQEKFEKYNNRMGQPPMAQPPAGQPPMGQPPMAQPPMGQPPVAQPPMAQKPADWLIETWYGDGRSEFKKTKDGPIVGTRAGEGAPYIPTQPSSNTPPTGQPPMAQPTAGQPPMAQPPADQLEAKEHGSGVAMSGDQRGGSLFSPLDVDKGGLINISPEQTDFLARRGEELGVEGSVFKEYGDARKALDQIVSGAYNLSPTQRTEAILQTRERLKGLSRRVINRRHEIGEAELSQSKREQSTNEGRINSIIARQRNILKEDAAKKYGRVMSPSEALEQALAEDMQSEEIRKEIGRLVSGQQPNLSETELESTVARTNLQQRRQRQMTGERPPVIRFAPETIANVSEYLREEYGEDLPYTLGMGSGRRGSGAMILTTPEGFSFVGTLHEASEIPVAVVTSDLEKQKADIADIPYVTDRRPQELQNPYERPEAGNRPSVGIASYDEDLDRTAFAEEVTAEIDDVWGNLQQYDEMTDRFTAQSRLFNRLTEYMNKNNMKLDSPSGEINNSGIAQLLQWANNDPELANILDGLGVTPETETLLRGVSPDVGIDDAQLNAIALRDRMVREQNRDLESSFRQKHGDELIIARDKVAQGKASAEYATDLRYIDRVWREGKVDERSFKLRYMQEEIERRLIEKQEVAQLQQDVLDNMTGAQKTQAGRQSLQENYQRSFEPNTGQSIMTSNERSRNSVFQFRALPAANINGAEVPIISSWEDMPHLSFDTPFAAVSRGKHSAEGILDRQAFDDAMEPVMQNRMKWGRFDFEGGDEHSRAVVDVMKLLMQSVPSGFFGDREALKMSAIEMVRRLGYTNRNDQNTARYSR